MNRKKINHLLLVFLLIMFFFSILLFYYFFNNNNFENIKNNKIFILKQEKNKDKDLINNNEIIKIYIWWDIMLSRMVGYLNQKEWFDRIIRKYNPITQTWWLIFFNLESPFSIYPKDWINSSYYFWAHTGSIEVLSKLKWDNKMIVWLANNHIRNSLKEWINTTINLLNKNNILFNWIWIKKQNKQEFTKIKINNKLVCLQAFSYDWGDYLYIKVNKIKKEYIKKSLDLMKKNNCDLNLISLHWWKEYKFEPSEKQVKLAHYTIDNWADMIIGHHSHIFWKTETYKNKPIFYSLWNYIFDQDNIVNNCPKNKDCIFDEKSKKKILPVNIWVAYELKFEKHKLISKIQKKHRIKHYWELIKY